MVHHIYQRVAKKFPQLSLKLEQAEYHMDPADFVKRISMLSIFLSVGMGVFFIFIFLLLKEPLWYIFPIVLVCYVLFFFYLIKGIDGKISQLRKKIDREILFVGKFMIAELSAGISLYQVIKNIESNYEGVQIYFKRILNDIDLGTGVDEAINNAILRNPSLYFQKVMYQVATSIKTGSDISASLDVVLAQINRRQIIEVEKYSRKLNPIALFYLMVAVIFPSIGMVLLIIVASFLGFPLTLTMFMIITGFLGFVQLMFVIIIDASRPAVEM